MFWGRVHPLSRMGVGTGDLERRRVEDLIAAGLYKARAGRVRGHIRGLYSGYEPYLRPLSEVRAVLGAELPEGESMGRVVVDLRRRETG